MNTLVFVHDYQIAADIFYSYIYRWKVEAGNVMKHAVTMKPILQFIAIKRADGGEWALPGVRLIIYGADNGLYQG